MSLYDNPYKPGRSGRNPLFLGPRDTGMFLEFDLVYLVSIAMLLFFVGGSYLFVRKILFGFRDGFESGRR